MSKVNARSGITKEKLHELSESGTNLSKRIAFDKFEKESLPQSQALIDNASKRGKKNYYHEFDVVDGLDCESVKKMVQEYYSDSGLELGFLYDHRVVIVKFSWE
jgi:hypothetical protein